MNDESISMNHAVIWYRNGEYYLKDNDSKCGTYVACLETVKLKEDFSFWAQSSNILMSFESKNVMKDCSTRCHKCNRLINK